MDRVREVQRCWIGVAAVLFAFSGSVFSATAVAERRHFSLPAGEAAETLVQFGREADRYVSYDFDTVQHQSTRAVDGDFEVMDALHQMLEDSGLDFHVSESGSVFVTAIEQRSVAAPSRAIV